jgi:histone acetyltransferase HTATIP
VPADSSPEAKKEFFVHWDAFNKRLDDWVSGSRLVLSRDLEWPRPKPPPQKKAVGQKAPPGKANRKNDNLLKKATANAATFAPSPAPQTPVVSTPTNAFLAQSPSPSPSTPTLKRKLPHDELDFTEPGTPQPIDEDDMDADGEADDDMDIDSAMASFRPESDLLNDEEAGPDLEVEPTTFSKEEEIEKLRTSGSMTQSISEIQRVKNLNKLAIGKHIVEAWYFSPYPKEFAHLPIIYICEFCLIYLSSEFQFKRHRKRCHLMHPPGNQIYMHEDISFWEIDGKKQVNWCRNLSLLSKCFLDQYVYSFLTPFQTRF